MFDLRDDGSIGIDFTVPSENGAPAEVRTVRVRPLPTMGSYKRVRAEMARIADESAEKAKGLRDDAEVTAAQFARQLNEQVEDDAIRWWKFVLVGDDTFAGLAEGEMPPTEDWPPYLATNDSAQIALGHWKATPLGRGGTLLPKNV